MTSFSASTLASLLWLAIATKAEGSLKIAEAEFINSRGEKTGTASLIETTRGVKISIQASNLPPGNHGIHFHETGTCTPPDFKSAGEHFSPDKKQHGLKHRHGPHAGDLPNLKVGANGTVMTEFTTSRVTLDKGKNSLLKSGSTAIIIHLKPDDQVTQPSGDSGDRIACGVITSESRARSKLKKNTS